MPNSQPALIGTQMPHRKEDTLSTSVDFIVDIASSELYTHRVFTRNSARKFNISNLCRMAQMMPRITLFGVVFRYQSACITEKIEIIV